MVPLKSHTTGRAIVIELPDTHERILVVEIELDCPSCGRHTVRFAGHHLRVIRNLVTEFIDLHPDLVGDEAGLEVLKRLTFSGTPPRDPLDN